jgi:hypothetical protein
MSKLPKSPDSAIKESEFTDVEEVVDPTAQAEERYKMWYVHLKQKYPTTSERKLKEMAAEFACLNRKERRRVFKHSSPKLPRFMKVPRG